MKVNSSNNPTIKDVARKANVSIATVSRVINNLSGYSDKTKQKVNQTIQEMGYQPNAIARGLIKKRTQTIAVMFPSVSSYFSADILDGIEEYASEHNYSILVCNTAEDGKRTMKYLQVLREKQVDGIVFSSAVLKEEYYEVLQAMNIPVILVSSQVDFAPVPYVKVDDKQAAYDAVEYLITQGHREIAMISGAETDQMTGAPRIAGYKEALQKHGMAFKEHYLIYADFGFDDGCIAMEKLLKTAPEATAIFAASDEMAVAVLSVAAKHGLKVPEDISVIGYDNLKLAEMVVPPLTTVDQSLYDMGELACHKLIDMIENDSVANSSIMPHRIVERQTVRRLT
ncbi:Catabolite control protein A [compost metagenome]